MKKALVLIPTYNEAGNIGSLIEELMALDVPVRLEVLIRDDKSPDGTADIVKKLANKRAYKGRIHLEMGDKKGLGTALRKSFKSMQKNHDHDYVMTMDGDGSHRTEDVSALLHRIEDGYDVVLGSRYMPGGMIPGDWTLFFFMRTFIATRVARWLGGMNQDIRELTTNFRVFTRDVLNEIDFNKFEKVNGYAFQIKLTNELTKRDDWKIIEMPIAFRGRLEGAPKGRMSDVLEFFRVAFQLNPDSPVKQIMRFLTIGASGAVVNIGALYALSELVAWNEGLLSLLAIQLSVVWNFFWHSRFTFKSYARNVKSRWSLKTLGDFAKYELSVAFTQLLTLTTFLTLSSVGIYLLLAQAAGIAIAFFINYYVSKTYIWTSKKPARA